MTDCLHIGRVDHPPLRMEMSITIYQLEQMPFLDVTNVMHVGNLVMCNGSAHKLRTIEMTVLPRLHNRPYVVTEVQAMEVSIALFHQQILILTGVAKMEGCPQGLPSVNMFNFIQKLLL